LPQVQLEQVVYGNLSGEAAGKLFGEQQLNKAVNA